MTSICKILANALKPEESKPFNLNIMNAYTAFFIVFFDMFGSFCDNESKLIFRSIEDTFVFNDEY